METASSPDTTPRPARRPRAAARRLGLAGAVLAGLLLTGCQLPSFGAYPGRTTQGHDSFKLWQGFFVAGLVVFVLVFFLIAWAMVRYRGGSAEIPRQTQYSTAFEIAYTIIPIVMVLVLFYFTVITENKVDAVAKDPAVTVTVTAFQWGWQFSYPSDGVRVLGAETQNPIMELPVGETVHVNLQSADVIHGFYVPKFNYSEYAQPGHLNTFDMNITQAGTYRGQCTQLCGLYHSDMFFRVRAVSSSDFHSWISAERHSHANPASISAAKAQIAKGALP